MVKVWLTFNVLDVMTTHLGLQLGALEANPIVAGLIGGVGEAATYAIKLLVVLIAAILLYKLRRPLTLKWLNLGMAAIVICNLAVLSYSLAG